MIGSLTDAICLEHPKKATIRRRHRRGLRSRRPGAFFAAAESYGRFILIDLVAGNNNDAQELALVTPPIKRLAWQMISMTYRDVVFFSMTFAFYHWRLRQIIERREGP